jgi:predicted DsbA family dithiol-disulfide isomerase
MPSHRIRHLLLAASFGVLSTLMIGASCGTGKANTTPQADAEPPPNTTPIPGVKLEGLSDSQSTRFYRLVDKAQSPCGKAESLRKALEAPSCRREGFAWKYLVRWLKEGMEDKDVLEFYQGRYEQKPIEPMDLRGIAYDGVPNAPIVIVEFFDYTCPHCRKMLPVLEDVMAEFPSDVVIYYRFFPLSGPGHEASVPAAMAAVAAQKQGKFKEMHKRMFASQDDLSEEKIMKLAKEAGLDMVKFEADLADKSTRDRVMADAKVANDLDFGGTPTIYVNWRNYPPIIEFAELKDWIDEELAVNQ